MNLNEQLREVLKDVLPVSPDEAILGTALLEMVRPRIVGSYTDNSIRQTFSYLSADPTSPLARVEQGFGYYKRPQAQVESEAARPVTRSGGRDCQHEEKFRAFFIRNSQYENRFPVHIEHTAGARQPPGVNKWEFPDVVELDWKDGEPSEDGFVLNKTVLEVKKSLGAQPFLLPASS